MQTGHIKSYLAALTLLWCVAMPAWAQTGVDNRPGIIMEIPAIPGEYATPYVMAGLQQLKAEMYKESLAYFEGAIKQDRANSYAYYLSAVALAKMADRERCNAYLNLTVKYFPRTEPGRCAKQLLASFKSLADREQARTGWAGVGSLPKETWIPYTRSGNAMMVTGTVNGADVKMIFDTGAESCVFTPATLRRLGIAVPTGAPDTQIMGVGKSTSIPAWIIRVNLKVGRMQKDNFPITVADMPVLHPLLGQQFFKDFTYSVDSSNSTISFVHKKDSGASIATVQPAAPPLTVNSSGKYVYTVPFKKQGDSTMVSVVVNGKPAQMVFDTGAYKTLFSESLARDLNINVVRRRSEVLSGVGGTIAADLAVLSSIKLGAIVKNGMSVIVTDKIDRDCSLLGQDFLQGWHYDIDNQAQVIRFTKAQSD
ncbi:MAG: retroviral-like aspartic protease family protein [Candidatus Obscuribacter sp.]|nr:retroviral-like aspartic protease family protein [Candidatus Obscuribacter sp.]